MRRMDVLVSELRERLGIDHGILLPEISERWDEVVGPELASVTSVCGVSGSVLRVLVGHPAAAMEISSRRRQLLRSINSISGGVRFTDIRTVRRSGRGRVRG